MKMVKCNFHNKRQTVILSWLLGVLFSLSVVQPVGANIPAKEKPVKVFILSGQSNAVGYNDIGELRTKPVHLNDLTGEHSPVLFWPGTNALPEFSGKWITLRPGVSEIAAEGAYKGGCFGPEIGFALTMSGVIPGEQLAIIKYAVGATGIARSKDYHDYIPGFEKFDDKGKNWSPPAKGKQAGLLYQELVKNIKAALDSLNRRGVSYEICGFLWMQGEHEAGISKKMAEDYDVLLSQFRKSIRSDLRLKRLPFVVGEINSHSWAFGDKARESQSKACREDKHTILIKTVDLPRGSVGGLAHFDADGMMELGKRFSQGFWGVNTGHRTPDFSGLIPAGATVFDFHGYQGYDFEFRNRNAKIVVPSYPAPGSPWVWRARFWGHEPQTDIALLERGFHVVYCDVAELFGNKEALSVWDEFYQKLRRAGLAKRSVMEGMSRGGVYIYRWAAVHPGRVSCIYADAPVLDLKSWPGGKGKGKGHQESWEIFKKDFNLNTDAEAMAFKGNPLDLVDKIVKAGFPMLHVVGDADDVVPVSENTELFEKKVKEAGGNIQVIHKPGVGHHPHSLTDPQPIVDFIMKAYGER
ncbi:MAG: sialate O-acetylesterase [Mangrovibacterium sp.]